MCVSRDQDGSQVKTFAGLTAPDFVSLLYKTFLRREPDPGAGDKIRRLAGGTSSVEDVVSKIISSEEYRSLCAPQGLLRDQTQFGELQILLERWVSRGTFAPVVVDVGARGKARSNSWDVMTTFGWRGLLIEANPNLHDAIRRDFEGLDFQLIHCAVAAYEGEA